MNTLKKTLKVPENRRVNFDFELPENFKPGLQLNVVFTCQPSETELREIRQYEAIEKLCGCWKNEPGSVDDFLAECRADKKLEIERENREEEASKYYERLSS